MSNYTAVAKSRRLRAVVLEMLQTNHDQQKSRLDSSAVWSGLVRGLGFDVSENEVITVLQDLQGRGYIQYEEIRNQRQGLYYIVRIQLAPRGRDLLEGTITDAAVGTRVRGFYESVAIPADSFARAVIFAMSPVATR